VIPDLQREFGWGAAAVGTLTSSLPLGFIAGTLVFALLALADRWSARRLFQGCSLAAGGRTIAAAASASGFEALFAWRALAGFLRRHLPGGDEDRFDLVPAGAGAGAGAAGGGAGRGQRQPARAACSRCRVALAGGVRQRCGAVRAGSAVGLAALASLLRAGSRAH
jgi:hypothetical protein